MVKDITNKNEFDQLIKEKKVLIDFFATWCGPCQMLEDELIRLSEEHNELTIVKVNIEKFNELAAIYNISYVPTLIYLVDGKIKKTTTGYKPYKSLERIIK